MNVFWEPDQFGLRKHFRVAFPEMDQQFCYFVFRVRVFEIQLVDFQELVPGV